ncbi:pimeloyl-ACP methyl ester esterase BioH [Pseudidiomarina insulisalsae]|uniref:Pimeloyl-[acyl-carrier protein] methyl ester esterase n=1 Tax=Pseudidiomarina insulisalsae TaxID=575789 RepID=A0A432YPM3_9GAMM|nr:pimeloyl-ACP methyl ester esterase BioH [Pseudidiomarina insulisalsae]RUO63025.1 pimeloyl-[acyl-carrier protein] methyl ester esterase [Pseudidiomarina insulisalsae]
MVAKVWSQVSGSGTDIVVLHGWGLNANIWTPVLPALEAVGRVTRIDLPGYGESPWPQELPLNFANLCDLTLQALPERCHLVGWSLGGLVATQLALQAPQRFHSLTTVASSPYFPAAAPDWPGIEPAILTQFGKQLSKDFRRTVERFLALQSLGSPHAKQDVKMIKEWLFSKPMAEVSVLDAGLDMLASVDLRAELARLSMPFLRIYGRLDALVPSKVVPRVDALTPQSESYIAPQCSHAPFISDPEAFMQALANFIRRVD